MARPAAGRPAGLTDAFREACEVAGLKQEQLAEHLGVHQTTVSKWLLGKAQPPLEHLPTVDALCGQTKGHILRVAGYVDDPPDGDVLAAIAQDPHVREDAKSGLVDLYRSFRRNFPR